MLALSQESPGRPAGRPTTAPTDQALMAAIARGEPAALALLYERHAAMVMATAQRVVSDRAEAEEICQELFLRVWLRASLFDPARGSAAAWFRRMAHNLAVNAARRRWANGPMLRSTDSPDAVMLQVADPTVDVERLVWERRQGRTLLAALAALPAAQRAVIVEAYFGGFTHTQIAARLGVPLGTVKSRINLGLCRLRKLLDQPAPMTATPRRSARPPERPAAILSLAG
jgi:RNA polymerase sigma-70 factor (ECF subfamily)